MIDVYVLDANLEVIGVIVAYKSLIWANRYNEVGDCELYLEANDQNIALLQNGNYLARLDDEMICQIKRVELDTNTEDGNYMIVNGYDAKSFLDQRIVWNTITCDGNLETFIRTLVDKTLISADDTARILYKPNGQLLLKLGNAIGFTESVSEQVTFKNVGEKIREYCKKHSWGYKVYEDSGFLWFALHKGTDRSDEVFFSNDYENLSSTKYVDDRTDMGNVALVAGQGEGSLRRRDVYGYAEGVDRFELYVDARDVAKTITWAELTAIYPTTEQGGQGYIAVDGDNVYYKCTSANIQVVDDQQLSWLHTTYPTGQEITIDGNLYYQIYDEIIADLTTDTPDPESSVVLRDVVYSVYLLNRGAESISLFGAKEAFEGSVIPDVTFVYKQDYFLGDVVFVENEFGIGANARIVEVIEVLDSTGYSVEPKFEYIEIV